MYKAGEKVCRTCRVTKDYRSYYRAAGVSDGYENQCKPCKAFALDPEHRKTYIREYRARKKIAGHYGLCCHCNNPLGRNDNSKGNKTTGVCKNCFKGDLHPTYKGGSINSDGYRVVRVNSGKTMLEHRLVMQDMIGRPLLPEETVHHLNGDRQDNKPENLELWSGMQPRGQRIADKVAWAKTILKLYGDMV